MTTDNLISDADLLSTLSAAESTRQQCLALLELLDSNALPPDTPLSKDLQTELSKQQKLLHSHLATVRNKYRGVAIGVRQTKQATAEARNEVDGLHLNLQNLYYERAHLKGEIDACEGYDHQYTQLPLIPLDHFLAEHPDLAGAEESVVMTARIEHEHAERQKLEEQRQGLLKQKQALIAENNKRKEDLANLDKDLEKFIDAAQPIVRTFEKEY